MVWDRGNRLSVMICFDRLSKLVGTGGATPALNAFEHGGNFVGGPTDSQLGYALGIALAAVVDPAEGDDTVLNLQINGGGTGSAAFVIEHYTHSFSQTEERNAPASGAFRLSVEITQ